MGEHSAPSTGLAFSNLVYDVMRRFVELVIPGFGTLYFALANIWGLPYAEQVVGTCTAVAVFGGVLLGISRKSYENSDAAYDGAVVVDTTNPEKEVFSIELNDHPMALTDGRKSIALKVRDDSTSIS